MKHVSEFVWGRIGFALLGLLAALVYSLVFYPVARYFTPDVSWLQLLKIFAVIFLLISLLSRKWLEIACLGSVYALLGFAFGLLASNNTTVFPGFSVYKTGRDVGVALLIGALACGVAVLLSQV